MSFEISFQLHGYSKNKDNLQQLSDVVKSNCYDFGDSYINDIDGENIYELIMNGVVLNSCWNLSEKLKLDELCKKLEVGLEIYGSSDRFIEVEDDEFDLKKLHKKEVETRFGDLIIGFAYGENLEDEDILPLREYDGYETRGVSTELSIFDSDDEELDTDNFR